MPAGRKVIGFNPPRSNYGCPYCTCHTHDFSRTSVINGQYVLRTREEWNRLARQWRDTPSVTVRKQLKTQTGVGWSELFRLPYWDPTRFFVVDGMHNLFLGLIQHHSGGTKATGSHTISPEDLRLLRIMIGNISTPSWLGRVSKNFGSPGHGTLKADEWRTAATVQLPMALTRLWAGTERQDDLDWFLDLVTAVQLATKRTMSVNRAEEFKKHMLKYLRGLSERGFRLLPNHHAAMHFGDFLPSFGPLRGWWAFPIERQIGLLQKIKTNNRGVSSKAAV
ncbi:hypothetical protein AURDEDRAFT_72787 [Auricularia subglabra TFB-10046 SS5]|nr:hypothetical protein AURDEDRAFT_72787 [Auricularia subglabra TFB-10046 SS5]